MKKKGFTLIELLAVIVIFTIIALVAVPLVLNVIEDAKKEAAIESANGILDAAEKYQMTEMLGGRKIENTIDLTGDILKYKGSKPDEGTLVISGNNKYSIIAKYGKYCVEKKITDEGPKIVDKEECIMEDDDIGKVEIAKIYGVKRELETSSSAWERTDMR